MNTVELLGTYGGDRTHALSAWTSTSRDLPPEKEARIGALLKQLADAGHETPFEKSALHFLVTVDTATHIHLIKHRIGVSINAESARYKEHTEDKYHVPDDWPDYEQVLLSDYVEQAYEAYHAALARLEAAGVPRKRAKESARFYLPYSSQVTLDIQFNFRSFVHFLRLRADEHAQREIHDLALEMLRLVRETGEFDLSLDAFGYHSWETP